jgi:hypothetical protein
LAFSEAPSMPDVLRRDKETISKLRENKMKRFLKKIA